MSTWQFSVLWLLVLSNDAVAPVILDTAPDRAACERLIPDASRIAHAEANVVIGCVPLTTEYGDT